MSHMPAKRKRARMGIVRAPRRVFHVHRANVRRHECSMPNCPHKDEPIEFSHVGPVGSKGAGIKAFDWWGVSWCRWHHRRAHLVGHQTACREAGTTLEAQQQIALTYARNTTDKAMRREIEMWHVDLVTGDMAAAEDVLFA